MVGFRCGLKSPVVFLLEIPPDGETSSLHGRHAEIYSSSSADDSSAENGRRPLMGEISAIFSNTLFFFPFRVYLVFFWGGGIKGRFWERRGLHHHQQKGMEGINLSLRVWS